MVAPHGGAWIEIFMSPFLLLIASVAPHGGAWIEIQLYEYKSVNSIGRSPRGSVD